MQLALVKINRGRPLSELRPSRSLSRTAQRQEGGAAHQRGRSDPGRHLDRARGGAGPGAANPGGAGEPVVGPSAAAVAPARGPGRRRAAGRARRGVGGALPLGRHARGLPPGTAGAAGRGAHRRLGRPAAAGAGGAGRVCGQPARLCGGRPQDPGPAAQRERRRPPRLRRHRGRGAGPAGGAGAAGARLQRQRARPGAGGGGRDCGGGLVRGPAPPRGAQRRPRAGGARQWHGPLGGPLCRPNPRRRRVRSGGEARAGTAASLPGGYPCHPGHSTPID